MRRPEHCHRSVGNAAVAFIPQMRPFEEPIVDIAPRLAVLSTVPVLMSVGAASILHGKRAQMQAEFMLLSRRHVVLLTFTAWLSMLGLDFFLHAGLLAELYLRPSPFLLPPLTAFKFIPVGYLSFLLLAALLVWLMIRLKLAGWREGAIFGLKLGGLTWGAFVLGLLSISTASFTLLMGWFIGQTLELSLAAAVVGSGLAGMRLRLLFGAVIIFVLLSVIMTVVLQSLGVVPTTRVS